MHWRMYGYGGDMAQAIPFFRSRRIEAVTAHYEKKAAELANANGISFYAVTVAMEAEGPDDLCVSAGGQTVEAPCPNARGLLERNCRRIKELATAEFVKGITLDYCRYPSPASPLSPSGMTVCFCSACCEKMKKEGLDVEALRRAVAKWPAWEEADLPLLRAFFKFRAKSVAYFVATLRDAVKEVDSNKEFGAYVFAPSLSPLVGQSYGMLASCVDFLSPMLYRHYPHPAGEACLDHELGALRRGMDSVLAPQKQKSARVLAALTGIDDLPAAEELKQKGVSIQMLWKELTQARQKVGETRLFPIVLFEDPRFLEISDAARIFGADGLDIFLFNRECFDRLDTFH